MKLLPERFVLAMICLAIGPQSFAEEMRAKEQPPIQFEYEMSAKDIERLESRVAGLKKGMSLGEVKSLLGEPTWEQTLYTKQFFGGGQFVAHVVDYDLKRVHKNDHNLKDHVISLYFDKSDKLMKAERHGYSRTGSYQIVGRAQIVEKIIE